MIFSKPFWLFPLMILAVVIFGWAFSCGDDDSDDDDSDRICELGTCYADSPNPTCPTFEVTCDDEPVSGCIADTRHNRGCCATQEELESLYCNGADPNDS